MRATFAWCWAPSCFKPDVPLRNLTFRGRDVTQCATTLGEDADRPRRICLRRDGESRRAVLPDGFDDCANGESIRREPEDPNFRRHVLAGTDRRVGRGRLPRRSAGDPPRPPRHDVRRGRSDVGGADRRAPGDRLRRPPAKFRVGPGVSTPRAEWRYLLGRPMRSRTRHSLISGSSAAPSKPGPLAWVSRRRSSRRPGDSWPGSASRAADRWPAVVSTMMRG